MFTLTITGTAPVTAASIPDVLHALTEQLRQRLPHTDATVAFQITTPGGRDVPGGISIPGASGEPLSAEDEDFLGAVLADISESLTAADEAR